MTIRPTTEGTLIQRVIREGLLCVLLVLLGVHGLSAQAPTARETTSAIGTRDNPVYKGKTYDEWSAKFHGELDPEKRVESLQALIAFGSNGKAGEVTKAILDLLDGYQLDVVGLAQIHGDSELPKMLTAEDKSPLLEAFGFLDENDMKLCRTALLGLRRLSPKAMPEIKEVLGNQGAVTTGQYAAMHVLLMRQLYSDVAQVLPIVIARNDMLSEHAWQILGSNEVSIAPAEYEECMRTLLQSKDQRQVLRVVEVLAQSGGSRGEVGPLLEAHAKTVTDPKVLEQITRTLEMFQKLKEPKVVPASGDRNFPEQYFEPERDTGKGNETSGKN